MGKQIVFFVLGMTMVILGITLTLKWWSSVVVLFQGTLGIGLALVGLVILLLAKSH